MLTGSQTNSISFSSQWVVYDGEADTRADMWLKVVRVAMSEARKRHSNRVRVKIRGHLWLAVGDLIFPWVSPYRCYPVCGQLVTPPGQWEPFQVLRSKVRGWLMKTSLFLLLYFIEYNILAKSISLNHSLMLFLNVVCSGGEIWQRCSNKENELI